MMKVPPLKINLKNIEKHDKDEKGDKHEKHEKHKEHKKHKKHKKHKHKHHHHDHEHSGHHGHKEHKDKQQHPTIKILNPPLLEPVGLPEPEHHLFPYQSSYAPPSPVPYPHVLHPVPTPPSQLEQIAKQKLLEPDATAADESSETHPPVLEDKVSCEPADDSKQSDENELVIEPPVTLEEAPKSPGTLPSAAGEQQFDTKDAISGGSQAGQDKQLQIAGLDVQVTAQGQESVVARKTQEPNSQMSFLKLAEDGSVRLNILAPIKQSDESNEKILNLEQVCGQLQDGLDVIPTDINEEECKEQLQVNPVEYVEPPAFGSYLPIKDSTFANLTKEDSETLLEIYGGNTTSFEYAESLQNFASGTNYLMKMVDSLLDLLTEGKHNKEAVPIRQKLEAQRAEARKEEAKANEPTPSKSIEKPTQNGDSLMDVDSTDKTDKNSKEGQHEEKMDVDMPPMENQEKSSEESKESEEVQKQLNEIDALLSELRKIQDQRLSSSPAPVEPDENETKLADEILEKMTKLIKEKAKPSEICDSSSILKAMGIPLDVQ